MWTDQVKKFALCLKRNSNGYSKKWFLNESGQEAYEKSTLEIKETE